MKEVTKATPWTLLGASLFFSIGLSGCASTEGGGEPAEVTNEYGDPIDSPAAQQLEMEEQMEAVTRSLIR